LAGKDFWQSTLDAQNFWSAASAVATSVGVLVALALPLYGIWQRRRQASRAVLNELRRNRELIDKFDFISRARNTHENFDFDHLHLRMVTDRVNRLSVSAWETFGPDVPYAKRACFQEAYDIFDILRSPDSHVVFGGMERPENQLALLLMEGRRVAKRFDRLVKDCRYLRE
jgi:hypothetical protein